MSPARRTPKRFSMMFSSNDGSETVAQSEGSGCAAARDYFLLSTLTRYVTSAGTLSQPPADCAFRRYLPLTMIVGVESTPYAFTCASARLIFALTANEFA